jgi:restriction system protein
MWQFIGEINFACAQCGEKYSFPVSDFESDVSSQERGMGAEHVYHLSIELDCDSCGESLRAEFDVSEYPIECINHITDNHGGIIDCTRPLIGHFPEIYSIQDAFEFRSSDIGELMSILECDPELVKLISRNEFEDVVAEIFRKQGFKVEQTKRTRDGGKDIIAFSCDRLGIVSKYFIECKHPDDGNKVSISLVREAYGVHNAKNGPNKTILVTTSRFTRDAKKFVDDEIRSPWEFELKDYNDVIAWLGAEPNKQSGAQITSDRNPQNPTCG